MKMVPEGRYDFLAFVLSKQAVINENTNKLISYGLMNQRSYNGRINTAAQPAYHFRITCL
jgi:hypothetical protein